MYYQVYIDSLFFFNFLFDLMLLCLLKRVLKCTATHLSLMAGAAFGAGAVCAIIILPYGGLLAKLAVMYFFVSAGMLRIAFKKIGMRGLVRALLLLYLFSFLFGGLVQMAAMHFPLFFGRRMRVLEAAGLACILFVPLRHACKKWRMRRLLAEEFVRVTLCLDGGEVAVTALVDTGNGLIEPISGKPVSIIQKDCMKAVGWEKEDTAYCAIPYHTIDRPHGMMEGMRISRMRIQTQAGEITVEAPILALSGEKIAGMGGYQMILNPKLLED